MTQRSTTSSLTIPEFLDHGKPMCAEVDPELFFPQDVEYTTGRTVSISVYSNLSAAKEICYSCPLIAECLEYAMNTQQIGIWGGTTERQREQLRKRNRAYSRIK